MPYANEHSAPVKSPGLFKDGEDDWASKDIAPGVRIVMGKLKNPPQNAKPDAMVTQTYRFDASKFTAEQARAWLKEHKVKYTKFEAATGEKNEDETADDMVDLNESTELNEDAMVSFMLEKQDAEAIDTMENYSGRAVFKQSFSGNGREYPEQVMKDAISDIQGRLPILMEVQHPRDGNMKTDLEKTTAIINKVQYGNGGEVILEDIRFVPTDAGKTMFAISKELAKSGASLGISQRATGKSHYVKNESNQVREIVDVLRIKKWDFTAPNEQGVKDAKLQLQRLTEDQEMTEKKVLTEDEVKALLDAQQTQFNEAMAALKTEFESARDPEPEPPPTPPPAETPEPPPAEPAENKALETMQATLNEQTEKLERLTRKEQLEELTSVGTKLMNEELAKEDYKRFTDAEKKVILESVKFEEIHGKVDMSKPETITSVILESLKDEISTLDKLIAAAKLRETGFPNRGTGNGLTRVEVLNENIPGMEFIAKLTGEVNRIMDQEDAWKLPDDHTARVTMKSMLESYDQAHYRQLLNEANEQVTVSDIGIKNASISRAFIEAVWPRLTALQVCETGTMTQIQDIIPVEAFLPAFSTDVHTDATLLQPAEEGTLSVAGITLTNYPILATPKSQSTYITSLARATAKGLAVDPVARTLAGLGNYIRTIMDRFLWELIIAKSQSYSVTGVTDWETCTRVGSTNEHYSANQGWVKFEYVKTLDGNGNPTSAKLIPLFGTTSGNTYQKVEARESGGDNTALTYSTHYTINWPDGTLTLTTAGAAECAADLVDVKYTYTSNAKFWSIVPDSGVTLYNHLLNLAQMVGQAKVMVRERYYDPNYVAMNIRHTDLIGKGPQFTTSGYTAGNVKDALAMVTNYDGQPIVESTQIPAGWIVCGKRGGAIYYVQTPWSIEGPFAIDNTRNRYWQVEEYSATDVPVTAKFGLVGVTDLNT